jgi:hypothetical protein
MLHRYLPLPSLFTHSLLLGNGITSFISTTLDERQLVWLFNFSGACSVYLSLLLRENID